MCPLQKKIAVTISKEDCLLGINATVKKKRISTQFLAIVTALLRTYRACLFRRKTSQVVSRKMRMGNVNCSRKNILYFTVFG